MCNRSIFVVKTLSMFIENHLFERSSFGGVFLYTPGRWEYDPTEYMCHIFHSIALIHRKVGFGLWIFTIVRILDDVGSLWCVSGLSLGTGHLKAMTRDMTLDSWFDNSSPRLEQVYRSDGCRSDHDGVEGVPAIRRMDLTFRLAISWMFLGMLFRGLIPHTHCYSCSMHQYSVRKIHAAQRLPG